MSKQHRFISCTFRLMLIISKVFNNLCGKTESSGSFQNKVVSSKALFSNEYPSEVKEKAFLMGTNMDLSSQLFLRYRNNVNYY